MRFIPGLASAIFALFVVLEASTVRANDMTDAAAASAAFCEKLSVLDDGTAMSAVFAQTPYITSAGPMTRDVIVGWPALRDYFAKANPQFKRREARLENRALHANGAFAWEVGLEVGEFEMAVGRVLPVNWVAINM
ncbi:MAG: hypothetical protein R3E87_06795 [Burkholderiaceae bacterium]